MAGRRIEECAPGFDSSCVAASLRAGAGAVGWLLRVVEHMKFRARRLALIRAMHRHNSTTFEGSGSPVAEVSVGRSIRQGCPLSASLFALCLYPLLRRFAAHWLLASARLLH